MARTKKAASPTRGSLIDVTEIPHDTDQWELFARDFLAESGFYIESTVDRGPDHGKDMLVTEQLHGRVGTYRLRWLVSCKHFAKSEKAVSEDHEPNILERLEHFNADGFIGFYSTLASSGLNSRLSALRGKGSIKDFSIYDHRRIESALVTVGYAPLMMRYFPASYQMVKPLHLITSKYEPLECDECGADLLVKMFAERKSGNLVYVHSMPGDGEPTTYSKVCVVCRGDCDDALQKRARAAGMMTAWSDLDDLCIPLQFLRLVMATLNRCRDGDDVYTDDAFTQEKHVLIALAQRVLRMTTQHERERILQLMAMPF